MTARRIFIALLFITSSAFIFAQKVRIKANNETLSSVIRKLNIEVSFDNNALSKYTITLDKSFNSADAAIRFVIAGKPLKVRKVAGVYIITSEKAPERKQKGAGKVEETFKPIPKNKDDTLSMKLSMSLKEIVITAQSHTPALKGNMIDDTGSFSSYTANAMPGHVDNSVFNVLRMMPGIRASGEPSDELYVWGSSPGESRVSLDGIPLFAMQSYNSNISYINPYISNEVKYKRGILSASEGSQVGAKVDAVSNMQYITKPLFKVMLSTMSANLYCAIPLKSSVLSFAYRHTLEDIFGGTTFDAYRNRKDSLKNNEHNNTSSGITTTELSQSMPTITPEYKFQDFNANITGRLAGTTFYKVSLYGAKDYLNYSHSDSIEMNGDQTSYQGGASALLSKTWDNGNKSEVSSFFSALHSTQSSNYIADKKLYAIDLSERVSQFNVKYQQNGCGSWGNIAFGSELSLYRVKNNSGTEKIVQPTLFGDYSYSIGNLKAEAGLRTDLMKGGIKWQPRALLKYNFLKYFAVTSSWGIYHQYLVKDPFALHENNYQFRWDINSELKSMNTVAGLSFDKGGLNISAEAYLKQIRNSIWVINNQLLESDFDIKGIDVSAKYNWRHGLFFASWSLSKDPRQTEGTANELKAGGILRYYPFTFSANFIYGTGFNSQLLPNSSYEQHESAALENNNSTTYSRMDVFASYEKRFRYFGLTAGVSLINVFDTDNEKYVTSWMPRNMSTSSLTKASSFTPIIFFEIKF
jgi:hypothetical protein